MRCMPCYVPSRYILANEIEGVYWFHFVRPSVRLSVGPSVHTSVDQIVSVLYRP